MIVQTLYITTRPNYYVILVADRECKDVICTDTTISFDGYTIDIEIARWLSIGWLAVLAELLHAGIRPIDTTILCRG